jgi:hypothetical protein
MTHNASRLIVIVKPVYQAINRHLPNHPIIFLFHHIDYQV